MIILFFFLELLFLPFDFLEKWSERNQASHLLLHSSFFFYSSILLTSYGLCCVPFGHFSSAFLLFLFDFGFIFSVFHFVSSLTPRLCFFASIFQVRVAPVRLRRPSRSCSTLPWWLVTGRRMWTVSRTSSSSQTLSLRPLEMPAPTEMTTPVAL